MFFFQVKWFSVKMLKKKLNNDINITDKFTF